MCEFLEDTVQHHMTDQARAVAPEMTVGDLLRLFAADHWDAYPVVRNEKLVGIVSKSDALKAFASDEASTDEAPARYDEVMGTTVDEVMTRHVMTVGPGTRLRHALQLMGAYRFESLPVVDDEGRLQGMIARGDMVRVLMRGGRRDAPPAAAPAVDRYAVA